MYKCEGYLMGSIKFYIDYEIINVLLMLKIKWDVFESSLFYFYFF